MMNQTNLRKFTAYIGDFKFSCTIEHTPFYLFDEVANDLARQYAKKLFGRHGNVTQLREGRHNLSPLQYWNYEGYISKSDKFGRFLEGRCVDFNFVEVVVPAIETRIQKRLRLLHQQIDSAYSIPELRHHALQARVLENADYYGVCPIPAQTIALADVLLD